MLRISTQPRSAASPANPTPTGTTVIATSAHLSPTATLCDTHDEIQALVTGRGALPLRYREVSVGAGHAEFNSKLCPGVWLTQAACYQSCSLRIPTTSETTTYAALRACSYSSSPG